MLMYNVCTFALIDFLYIKSKLSFALKEIIKVKEQ